MKTLILEHQSGTPTRPLIIDGCGETLDGEHTQPPLIARHLRHVIIRGFDACNSPANVVQCYDCEDVLFEQCCAWNASVGGNHMPWRITNSNRVTLRDCAGWGTGRKIYTFSQGADDCRLIRCYGLWERSTSTAPQMTFGVAYNNFRQYLRHCIGQCIGSPSRFYGVFSADRIDSGEPARAIISQCAALSPLQVTGFTPQKVAGIAFSDCLDATGGRMVNPGDMAPLIAAWCESPILGRLRELAGVDVLTDLLSAVRFTEPTPIPVT